MCLTGSFLTLQMIAADILEAFQSAESSSAELSSVGKRFRETFLELGGTCSGSEVFRRFLGRDPSPESLLNAYGLQNKPPTSAHE